MRRCCVVALAVTLAGWVGIVRAQGTLVAPLQVLGSVRASARPVGSALILALNLDTFDAIETFSKEDGSFALPPLRAGFYRIIAMKHGFAPASAVVLPGKKEQKVTLAMRSEKEAGNAADDDMWRIRAAVPPDVLRDIEMAMAVPVPIATPKPRFRGEIASMTGVGTQTDAPAFAQTALGVDSRIGDAWQLGFHGNLNRIEDPNGEQTFGEPAAEASTMSMELRSAEPGDAYRVASTKSWWRFREDDGGVDRSADLRAHNFEWEHGGARLQVRYLAQQGLFLSSSAGSDLVEVGGESKLFQTERTALDFALRVAQENATRTMTATTMRRADVATTESISITPELVVRAGVSSRIAVEGSEWAPHGGIEWRIAPDVSLVTDAAYKVVEMPRSTLVFPTLVAGMNDGRFLPRYHYSVGIVAGPANGNHVSAVASVMQIDSTVRLVFTDWGGFWDGVEFAPGDVRRDLQLSCRRDFGSVVSVDLTGSGGSAHSSDASAPALAKSWVSGEVQSTWRPTGTALLVALRHIDQPAMSGRNYRSERLNVRVSQPIHLPVDVRVLLGLELAHSENSPFLADTMDPDGYARRYVGGFAVNF